MIHDDSESDSDNQNNFISEPGKQIIDSNKRNDNQNNLINNNLEININSSTNYESEINTIDKPEIILNEDEIEELKELIKNWLEIDEKTKVLADEMKDLKLEKKQYETYILEFMDKTNKEVIKTKESTLRKDVKETKGSPKEEHILKTLTEILTNAEQAYKITQQIIDSVPTKEVISLKKEKNTDKKPKKTFKRTNK
jgi:hypothetical protein